jgi:hypothetical protein
MALILCYGYSNAQPNGAMSVNMAKVLEHLPVKLTKLEDWVRSHANAFAVSSASPSSAAVSSESVR